MKNGFKVFDADMHIMEDLKFVEYMDPEYRDRGPKAAPADESFPDFTGSNAGREYRCRGQRTSIPPPR